MTWVSSTVCFRKHSKNRSHSDLEGDVVKYVCLKEQTPLDEKSLDLQTRFEIFQNKRHFKKPLNFINYSGCDFNPINNDHLEATPYTQHFQKKI